MVNPCGFKSHPSHQTGGFISACNIRGYGSVGRAPRSQRGGQGFEFPYLHQVNTRPHYCVSMVVACVFSFPRVFADYLSPIFRSKIGLNYCIDSSLRVFSQPLGCAALAAGRSVIITCSLTFIYVPKSAGHSGHLGQKSKKQAFFRVKNRLFDGLFRSENAPRPDFHSVETPRFFAALYFAPI